MTDRIQQIILMVILWPSLGLVLVGPHTTVHAQSAEKALALRPVQSRVDYELVRPEDVGKCSLETFKSKSARGFELTGPDGSILRRFIDTNGDKSIDQWCYFNFGVEVYRDIDEDFNGKADQYRWLNTGGTRWGLDDNEDGKIDRWKAISAEEATAEVVAALSAGQSDQFAALLISEQEIKSLGLGPDKSEQISVKANRAAGDFDDLASRQKKVGPEARWVQFAASAPGIVPSGTDGSTKDVLVYENAVAMFEDGEENGQLMVGTLIRVGDAWRVVELPMVGSDGDAIAQSTGNFFTAGATAAASASSSDSGNSETQQLVNRLEQVDKDLNEAKDKADIAELNERRADTVEAIIAATRDPDERATWVRQLVDTLSVAAQTGAYPAGANRLRQVARKLSDGDNALQSYADYQAINTEYIVRQTPEADFAKVQEWYLESLTDFVDTYPGTPEAANAWLQLGLSKEFEDKEEEALKHYKRVASSFPDTDSGRKAAGAVRRLESVGRRIDLEGQSIDGSAFKLSSLRGRPVVLHYWATWCEPCKQDMKLLRKLQASYQKAGLQIVGISVDQSKREAMSYLDETQLPWTQLFEDGGLESSRLATALGVQTLPTMMLIDRDGTVVRHNVRAVELDDELTKMLKPNKR